MPLYEYSCAACGAVAEINHRMSDPAPTDCPACGAARLSKMISAAGFRLKGSGWYETDFKSGDKKNLVGDAPGVATADSKPATGTAAKSETKSETKAPVPAKAESKPTASPSASSTPG